MKTRRVYDYVLKKFVAKAEIKDLGLAEPKDIQDKLIQHVVDLRNAGKSYSAQNITVSAVQKFCDAYDKEVNFRKVRNYLGENVALHEDAPYSMAQLRKMVDAADIRRKAIILTLLSTGVRSGAPPDMKLRHLKRMDNGVYKITAYAKARGSEYNTFTTLEAAQAIDAYLKSREIKGEKLNPDSPLFRDEIGDLNANGPKALTTNGIARLMFDHLVALGIRVPGLKKGGRHQTPLLHGFRKNHETALAQAGVKPLYIGLLRGDKIGIQGRYLRPSEQDLMNDYLKAVDLLTVSNEKALLQEVEKLKLDTKDLEQLKKNYLDMRLEVERIKENQKKREDDLDRMQKEFAEMPPEKFKQMQKGLQDRTQNMDYDSFRKAGNAMMTKLKKEKEEDDPKTD